MKTLRPSLRPVWAGLVLALACAGLALFWPRVAHSSTGLSLRFYGHGVNDIDRVKIRIDPQVPVDVGAVSVNDGDFTLEFWIKANLAENGGRATCNANDGWVTGNIILDRDVFGAGDYGDYGVSLTNGRVAFGVSRGANGNTVCGSVVVANGQWHHVALTRQASPGRLTIFVDGVQVGQGSGPTGDVSYRNGRSGQPDDPFLVIGAEKHDISQSFPSFSGWLAELRVSMLVRYTANFTRPAEPFTPDANTAALYHLDQGPAGACTGIITDSLGLSPGVCSYGGAAPAGPVYVADTPFVIPPATATATSPPTPTATATPSASPEPTLTNTPTATATTTPSSTATSTSSATPQPTLTNTSTATATATPSQTPSATPSASPEPTLTNTATATATATPLPTATSTPSATPQPTLTDISTVTATATPSRTPSATPSASPAPTLTKTETASPTVTATAIATAAASQTSTSSPTQIVTAIASATATARPSPTAPATATRTATHTRTATAAPTATETSTFLIPGTGGRRLFLPLLLQSGPTLGEADRANAAAGTTVYLPAVMKSVSPTPPPASGGYALRFYGHGVAAPDLDRVKISLNNPARPVDVSGDFTLEFWLKAQPGANPSTNGQCDINDGWITGNIVVDRDIYGGGDYGDYGLSLSGGQVVFGVSVGNGGTTACGATDLADGVWHHVAVTRSGTTGQMRVYVDGVLDGQGSGPAGNVSYRDGRSGQPDDPYLVIGAEKHDAGPQFPSFSGWVDEVRVSNVIRYAANFTRPAGPFTADANTVGLYHFDEGPAAEACTGTVLDGSGAAGGPSNGVCNHGGAGTAGPVYTSDNPFP